jgi:predicted RNA binding protein YcfA (HicA-like mRNA interferase family)
LKLGKRVTEDSLRVLERRHRNLSGRELVQMLVKNLGYEIIHQRGSHVVLESEDPSRHRIAIPDHESLRPQIFANWYTECDYKSRDPS